VRIDEQTVHAEDVQAGSGREFYGTPIREMCSFDADIREQDDLQMRVRASFGISVSVELLPGEVIKGNIIRRETDAEVAGEKLHEQDDALYFDLDLPKVAGGWKTSDVLDEFGKMMKSGEFFPEAPEALRHTFKDGMWYDAQGKVVTFELSV
jgi:hypothetical protein